MEEAIVLTEAEIREVEKGIRYSRVVVAQACIIADAVRLSTKLKMIEKYIAPDKESKYFEVPEDMEDEIQQDIDKTLKDIENWRRLVEMWKKHPIHD